MGEVADQMERLCNIITLGCERCFFYVLFPIYRFDTLALAFRVTFLTEIFALEASLFAGEFSRFS